MFNFKIVYLNHNFKEALRYISLYIENMQPAPDKKHKKQEAYKYPKSMSILLMPIGL